eukprot:3428756-Prymnesium_polylepis.1
MHIAQLHVRVAGSEVEPRDTLGPHREQRAACARLRRSRPVLVRCQRPHGASGGHERLSQRADLPAGRTVECVGQRPIGHVPDTTGRPPASRKSWLHNTVATFFLTRTETRSCR